MALIGTFAAIGTMCFGRQKIARYISQVLQHKAGLIMGWRALRNLPENHVLSYPSRFSGGGGVCGHSPALKLAVQYIATYGIYFLRTTKFCSVAPSVCVSSV